MKCRWSHCKHGGEVNKSEAVKEGSSYYHPECYAERKAINEIIRIYHEKVDAHPVESYLRGTINDLIYKQDVSAEFLLFALQFCIDHGWSLHTPGGLRYVAKDVTAKKTWVKMKDQETLRKLKDETTNIDVSEDWSLPEIKTACKSSRTKFSNVLGV